MKIKSTLALFLAVLIFLSPLAPTYAMTEEELRERLDTVKARLVEVANQITTTPGLSEEALLTLMTELVSISSEVIDIQNELSPLKSRIFFEESVNEDATRDSVEDVGITSSILSYDSAGNAGNIRIETTSRGTITRGYSISPAPGATYDDELDLIKKTVFDDISSYLNVKRGELADVTMIRSVHPSIFIPGSIGYNSDLALDVASRFGYQSIITDIFVWPGVDYGYIDFKSEFGETMRLSLKKVGAQYIAKILYTIAFTDIGEMSLEIDDEDIVDFTTPITERVPFAAALLNFDRKFINFLTNNNTKVLSLSTFAEGQYHPERECYYNSDKIAFSSYLKTLVSGAASQVSPAAIDSVKYAAPAVTISFEDSFMYSSLPHCENRARYF